MQDELRDAPFEGQPSPVRIYLEGSLKPWPEPVLGRAETPRFWTSREGALYYKGGSVSWPEVQVARYPELSAPTQAFARELAALLVRHGAVLEGTEEGEVVVSLQGCEVLVARVSQEDGGAISVGMEVTTSWVPKPYDQGLEEYQAQIRQFEETTGETYPEELRQRILTEHRQS